MTIKRMAVDSTTENQIITGMITSTKFLSEIRSVYASEYFQNSFAKVIGFWCMDYFDQYKKAPGIHIKDIYNIETEEGLADEDKEIIAIFLDKLSKQYSEGQEINADYIRDNAFSYFRKRSLELSTDKMQKLLNIGKIDEAEEVLLNHKKVAYQLSGWFNPFDNKEILDTFLDDEQEYFALPGAIGHILGKMERDWFIAVLAPFKRGKSFFLQEMAVRALYQKFKVVFISLEMQKKNLKERLYRRLTAFGNKYQEDVFIYPAFDCVYNQDGSCGRKERINRIPLIVDGAIPEFNEDLEYRPCAYCRDHHIAGYAMTTWFEPMTRPKFDFKPTKSILKSIETMYGNNIRYMSYPRFTAGLSDIRRDLYLLEQKEEFIPDIIIIDYADILKPDTKGDKRNQIDDIWKMLASMAAERHCILFTASQGTRGSIYKPDVTQEDLAEWIGKLGHVDIFLGLNQTKADKKSKLLRVNVLVHRHKEIDESLHALLLQQLEVGQFSLDSELMRENQR